MKRQQTLDVMMPINSPHASRAARLLKSPALALTLALTLVLTLVFGLLRLWQPVSTAGDSLPALQGEAAINHLKETGQYASLQEAMTAARYGFFQEPARSGEWLANNPAQRLSARFSPDGLQVETAGDGAQSHRLGMRLRSAGYGERQMSASAGRLTAKGERAEIRHDLRQSAIGDSQSAITEWYINRAAGLEQGFTLESAPGERREGEWLRVALALKGELRADAVEGGQALEFTDKAGQRSLRYDHLVAYDAGGRELEARMTVNEKASEVWLEVDDRDAVWPVTIDPTFTQQQKLEILDRAQGDPFRFGASLAISGETVVVGAPEDDDLLGAQQGSAFVFVRSGGVWTEQQQILASDAAGFDRFGSSVAISGGTIVVGAPFDDGAAGSDLGSAYVFVRSGGVWTEQQKLENPNPAGFDRFGFSVAISGETIVVGAPNDSGAMVVQQGSAYVFVRSGGVWSEQQKLEASDPAQSDVFGRSVAINGETIVVGAPWDDGAAGEDQGSAYVFVRSGGVWTEQQKLEASDPAADDEFGRSVAINGETIVVGAPLDDGAAGSDLGSAYVFVRSGGEWTEQKKLEASDAKPRPEPTRNPGFGASVAISGETVLVGDPADPDAAVLQQGSAYVFVRSGGEWTEQQKVEAQDTAAGDDFGASVAISGETIVAGAPFGSGAAGEFQGSAYVFAAPANTCGITVNPASLPQPYIGVPYFRILFATPIAGYDFSVSSGALPPGLQLLNAFGVNSIAGLPATPGTYNFTIKAKKKNSTCEATRDYTLTIPATVVPILECVQQNQDGSWTARFGYDNSTGAAVTIPVGPNNYFTPGSQDRGQTTVFEPGRVTNAFSATFTKGNNNNLAIWLLRGPDGVLRPVNALTTSIGCP